MRSGLYSQRLQFLWARLVVIHFVHAHHGDYVIRFFRYMEKLLNKDFALNRTLKGV